MILLSPGRWKDYELIDCGSFEKLERFGEYITIRPEPQAVWDKSLPEREWEKSAHVRFVPRSSSSGVWNKLKKMPDQWTIRYGLSSAEENREITFRLGLTSFKHVGIFPEQAVNWDFIFDTIRGISVEKPKVLNLFAYTGGASLAARAAGADVTHLDSVKQVVSWTRENMELSGLKDIRWVVEDALTYVKREVKRGKKYNGIILDPPAYGQGANGERWKLEDNINEMMKNVLSLLEAENSFLILNTYSLGFSALILDNLLKDYLKSGDLDVGELFLKSSTGYSLPLGVFARYKNIQNEK
jgi:23S rRNA (cytosine1962-C5)-methyltransferase